MMVEEEDECPKCGSGSVYKDGIRYTRSGEVQRYHCRNCGYRFSRQKRFASGNSPLSLLKKLMHKATRCLIGLSIYTVD